MAMKEESLYDDFVFKGNFWLPEKPDIKVSGTLTFNNQHIYLELIGAFYDHHNPQFAEKTIHGISYEGRKCSLFQNYMSNYNSNYIGTGRMIYHPNIVIIGTYLNSIEETLFINAQVHLNGLEEWLGNRPFYWDMPGDSEWSIKFTPDETFAVSLESIQTIIELQHHKSLGREQNKMYLYSKPFLMIKPHVEKSYEWYFSVIRQLEFMFTLFMGFSSRATVIKPSVAEPNEQDGQMEETMLTIFYMQEKLDIDNPLSWHYMPVPYRDLKPRIIEVFNNWFDKVEKLINTFNLFFPVYYTSAFVEQRFLSLIQSIESFYRGTRDEDIGCYMPKEEWERTVEKIISNLPSEIWDDFRSSLKTKMKHANEKSFRNKFVQLYSSFEPFLREKIIVSKEYINKIIDTRNNLIHYGSNDKADCFTTQEIVEVNARLQAFVIALILKELGFDDNQIHCRLHATPFLKQVLDGRFKLY